MYWRFKVNSGCNWLVDDGLSEYALYDNSGRPLQAKRTLPRNGDPAAALLAQFGPRTIVERNPLLPGQYYPRIHRFPNYPRISDIYQHEWLQSVRSVRNILSRLENVFSIVEPTPANAGVFGHELRHLLILACTEVESSCKAVLRANTYTSPGRWSTNDYVKVVDPLRLRDWEVALTHCPGYPPFMPFLDWDPARPTESLAWYKSYNNVKHDRETTFSQATFEHAIAAAAAAYVLVIAQFGKFGLRGVNVQEIDAFHVTRWLDWPLAEHYIPPALAEGSTWTSINYVF